MLAIKSAATWLLSAVWRFVLWVLSIFQRDTSTKPKKVRGWNMPPGSRDITPPRGYLMVNPVRRLRRVLTNTRHPELRSGRQWVKFRKHYQRIGISLKRLAHLMVQPNKARAR